MQLKGNLCYCAFCRSERRVYRSKHVSALHILATFGLSVAASYLFWDEFDPRALMFFVSLIGIAEVYVLLRWRLSIACSRCGFDPVLYRKDAKLAVSRVKRHYQQRRDDPASLLSPPPRLPSLIRKRDENGPGKDQSPASL